MTKSLQLNCKRVTDTEISDKRVTEEWQFNCKIMTDSLSGYRLKYKLGTLSKVYFRVQREPPLPQNEVYDFSKTQFKYTIVLIQKRLTFSEAFFGIKGKNQWRLASNLEG